MSSRVFGVFRGFELRGQEASNLGFRVQGSRVWGLGSRVQVFEGLGFQGL